MVMVYTNLVTRESARKTRFEPVANIPETDVQNAIAYTALNPPAKAQTDVTASPYDALVTDDILRVNFAGAATIYLLASATRNGKDILIKDTSGNASTNNITIVPSGAETIDGLTSVTINTDFGGFRLSPTAAGWDILP